MPNSTFERTAGAPLALALLLLLAACATTMSPEQARVEGIAQKCLEPRNRATLREVEVDYFGRLWIHGRHTADWTSETEAFQDCMETKGWRSRNRPGPPVLK